MGEFVVENNSLSCCFCKFYKHMTGHCELGGGGAGGGLKLKLHCLTVNPAGSILNMFLCQREPVILRSLSESVTYSGSH